MAADVFDSYEHTERSVYTISMCNMNSARSMYSVFIILRYFTIWHCVRLHYYSLNEYPIYWRWIHRIDNQNVLYEFSMSSVRQQLTKAVFDPLVQFSSLFIFFPFVLNFSQIISYRSPEIKSPLLLLCFDFRVFKLSCE